jgi:hypothetical protein
MSELHASNAALQEQHRRVVVPALAAGEGWFTLSVRAACDDLKKQPAATVVAAGLAFPDEQADPAKQREQ